MPRDNEFIKLPLINSLLQEQSTTNIEYSQQIDASGNVNINGAGTTPDTSRVITNYIVSSGFYEQETPTGVPFYATYYNGQFQLRLSENSTPFDVAYSAPDGRVEYFKWEILHNNEVVDTVLFGAGYSGFSGTIIQPNSDLYPYEPSNGQYQDDPNSNQWFSRLECANGNVVGLLKNIDEISGFEDVSIVETLQIRATIFYSQSSFIEQIYTPPDLSQTTEGGTDYTPQNDDTGDSRTVGGTGAGASSAGGGGSGPTYNEAAEQALQESINAYNAANVLNRTMNSFTFEPIELQVFPAPNNGIQLIATFASYAARIQSVDGNQITVNQSWNTYKDKVGNLIEINPNSNLEIGKRADDTFVDWSVSYKINDRRNLNTYLHLGDGKLSLITNVKSDIKKFPELPHAIIYKLYEPLSEDFEVKDNAYIVREILPQVTENVELIPFDQPEDVLVLKIPDTPEEGSPITKREVEFKSYEDLITNDSKLQDSIIDKYISGSDKPVSLNLDYSRYENYVNFSSAQIRLENFKYKIEQIEENTALSSSFVGVTSGSGESLKFHKKIHDIKNNFDGYENYLYGDVSTYVTSSMGEFFNASWPKTGSGTYNDPFVPVSSSNADFISWYGNIPGKTGQLYSASLYDTDNLNRLVNLLPEHISDDRDNSTFTDFMDMIGQQFDELWAYIQGLSDITDRQSDLNEGFSKDLIYTLAKSLGWEAQDGKDLLDLSQAGFGQKAEGSGFSLYTSGSLSSPNETDVSKEITKRLIASMPYLLKAKGTIGSLKGLLNIYGIPSTILRVREFGGMQEPKQRDAFEISRKFTKALGFRGAQYVSSSWADDSTTSRKPETVELRFRSVSGSNQTLIQKDDRWAIRLKDNGSADNFGTVSFILSGSTGQKEVSSSLLPVFDGDYYSLMLKKRKVETNLFPNPSFEVSGLFNPPFVTQSLADTAHGGELKIVSSSNVARTGAKSLEHKNTLANGTSYSLFFKNPSSIYGDSTSAISTAVSGQTFTFSAFAKTSASMVDSLARIRMFELDANEEVVNWDEDNASGHTLTSLLGTGGIASSQDVGLNETEWKQITVTKHIKFPQTAKLGVRLENRKAGSTIYWDDINVVNNPTNSDSIGDTFSYDLSVKKYEAGLDRIIQSSEVSMLISGSNTASQSFNASWSGSGDLFIGGNPSDHFGNQLTGSIMEFRLWNEPLQEQHFDTHVGNPKSYVGNSPSSSYYSLVTRYSFDDNTVLSNGTTIRDVSSNQTTTSAGFAFGFGGVNTFENVEDKTKTMVPNYGPNRRSSTKIRIENNILSGSAANLSVNQRFDVSSNDFAPLDSPKVGIYFSPTDVVNEDIILSFANLDFNQYLGDPRDNFKLNYPGLHDTANEYFQKYTGRNDFWDYMRLIKYYDQSLFKQIKKLIPARAKPQLGTVIEPNILERSKSPVQRNRPSFTLHAYEKNINLSNFGFNDEPNMEVSHSVLKISTEYPNYEGTIDKESSPFLLPSLYKFDFNHNLDDIATYVSASVKFGGPDRVFQEPTGSVILNQRLSEKNQEYRFFYTSSVDFDRSQKYSLDNFLHLYSSRSLVESEFDTEYQNTTALDRLFYKGCKNTKYTTIDGDSPVVIRTTSPTIAVPTDTADSNMKVVSDRLGKNKTKIKRN